MVGWAGVWQWNGTDWTQVAPATLPPARMRHSIVWDRLRDVLVLFGGLVLFPLAAAFCGPKKPPGELVIDAEYGAERRTQQLGAGEQGGDLVRVVDHHGEPLEPRVQREDIVHLVGRQRHRVQDVVEAAVGEEGCLGERGHESRGPLCG